MCHFAQSVLVTCLVGATCAESQFVFDLQHVAKLCGSIEYIAVFARFLCGSREFFRNFSKFCTCTETNTVIEEVVEVVGKQHIFCRVFGITCVLNDVVWHIDFHKLIVINAKHSLEFRFDQLFVGVALGILGKIEERGQLREVRALAAVVAPHREENVFDLLFAASVKSGNHRFERVAVARNHTDPAPSAARKPSILGKLSVVVKHIGVALLSRSPIIPKNGNDLGRECFNDLFGHFTLGNVIFAVVPRAEEHIRPNHHLVVVFLCDIANASEVTLDDGVDGLVAVNIKMLAATEVECLVHTDVDALGAEALRERGEHVVDKLIGTLVVGQNNVAHIDGELAPTGSGG